MAIDLSLGLNFTVGVAATPRTLGNPSSGKAGQAGVIEISAISGDKVINKGTNWRAVASMFPLTVQSGTKAHLFYSVMASTPSLVICTGIINNPG